MRLTIKDFSVLKDVDINLDDVTVIIGEQASGKSLTARVLFFILKTVLFNELLKLLDNSIEIFRSKDIDIEMTRQFKELFPENFWKNGDFEIQLKEIEKLGVVEVKKLSNGVGFKSPKIDLRQDQEFLQIIDFIKFFQEKDSDFNRLLGFVRMLPLMNINIGSEITYIPAVRSFFSTIDNNIFSLINSKSVIIDPILKNFGQDYKKAKLTIDGLSIKDRDFDQVAAKIIKGEWTRKSGNEVIVRGQSKTPLAHASSGQQEALPLVLMLKKELLDQDRNRVNKTIVIEEPEAHLFPASQRAIVDLIFQVKRQCPHVKFLITTHSPYILTCINNEIMKAKRDKVTVGVDSYFMADGVSTRIFDDETGLINGEKLDEISGEIADEFYELLESEN